MRAVDFSLYAITPEQMDSTALYEAVEEALEAGITVLQVRRKAVPARRLIEEARHILGMAAPRGIPVLVNDRLDVALAASADGVHLGQDDVPLEDARRMAPAGFLIGLSTHNASEAREADRSRPAYVAIGPVWSSPSKETGPPGGPELVASVRKVVGVPLVAIGGILPAHVPDVMAAGADGVAVISGIFSGGAIRQRVREYREAIAEGLDRRGRSPLGGRASSGPGTR